MKREHTLEVRLSPELQDKVDRTYDHVGNHRDMFLLGLGIVIGAFGMRMFTKPTTIVVNHTP